MDCREGLSGLLQKLLFGLLRAARRMMFCKVNERAHSSKYLIINPIDCFYSQVTVVKDNLLSRARQNGTVRQAIKHNYEINLD